MRVQKPRLINFPTSLSQSKGNLGLFVRSSEGAPESMRGQLHRHHFYEINWLAEGEATLFNDFARFPLHAGALVITVPGQLHTWEGDWDKFILYVFGFTLDFLSVYPQHTTFLNELPIQQHGYPCKQLDAEQKLAFDHLFATAIQKYAVYGQSQPQLIGSYLNVILSEAQLLYENDAPIKLGDAATQLTKDFRLAVESSYLERKKVQDYAALLGVTDNHLVESVNAVTGTTPGQIIHQRLLLEAKRLLVHTPATVAEIAEELAFPTSSQFGRWFKNLAASTPQQFRKQFTSTP